jgi:hypothetical protein
MSDMASAWCAVSFRIAGAIAMLISSGATAAR